MGEMGVEWVKEFSESRTWRHDSQVLNLKWILECKRGQPGGSWGVGVEGMACVRWWERNKQLGGTWAWRRAFVLRTEKRLSLQVSLLFRAAPSWFRVLAAWGPAGVYLGGRYIPDLEDEATVAGCLRR